MKKLNIKFITVLIIITTVFFVSCGSTAEKGNAAAGAGNSSKTNINTNIDTNELKTSSTTGDYNATEQISADIGGQTQDTGSTSAVTAETGAATDSFSTQQATTNPGTVNITNTSNAINTTGTKTNQTNTNTTNTANKTTQAAVKTTAPKSTSVPATATPIPGKTPVKIANDPIMPAIDLTSKVPADLRDDYTTFYNGINTRSSRIIINKDLETNGSFKKIYYYLKNYNPQLFYIDWNSSSEGIGTAPNGTIVQTSLKPYYISSFTDNDIKKVDEIVNSIVNEANKKPNLFERELYVHDYLVNNIEYNTTTANCGNIYGALVEGKALCEGYSRAFQYIMNKLGIETYLITGVTIQNTKGVPPNVNHMWNMIKLYGSYYFVDVTFDDPIGRPKTDPIPHDYFNVTTAEIKKTRNIDAKNSFDSAGMLLRNMDLQDCTATAFSYKTIMG